LIIILTLPSFITQAGPTALSQLTDVSFTTLIDNQVLRWTSSNGWRNQTFNMRNLADTSLTQASMEDYDIIFYTNGIYKRTNILKNNWELLQSTTNISFTPEHYLYFNNDGLLTDKQIASNDISDLEDTIHNNMSISYITKFQISSLEPRDILVSNLSGNFVNILFSTMTIDIDQLVDFNASAPNNGQILVASDGVWTAVDPTTYSSVYRTKDLADWVTSNFSNLQIPQYISATSKFTTYTLPNFLTSIPINSISLDDVTDVSFTTPVARNLLV